MKTSKDGLELIKKFEGLRLKSYKAHPSEAKYTIGYGHYGVVLVYNVIRTVRQGSPVENELAEASALAVISPSRLKGEKLHSWLERKPVQFMILTTIAILIGGLIQILPTILVKSNIPTISSVKPYTT